MNKEKFWKMFCLFLISIGVVLPMAWGAFSASTNKVAKLTDENPGLNVLDLASGYVYNATLNETKLGTSVDAQGYRANNLVLVNATFVNGTNFSSSSNVNNTDIQANISGGFLVDMKVGTGATQSLDMNSKSLTGVNTITAAASTNAALKSAAGQVIFLQNSTSSNLLATGETLGTEVMARASGHFIVDTHNRWELGASGTKWKAIYAVTNGIGDLQEEFSANPGYTYGLGDVVALDNTSSNEIRPVSSYSDRIFGVVAVLPRTEQRSVMVGNTSTLQTVTIDTYAISIYGKTQPSFKVKVKGTINKGDYLVYSGTPGVASSLYNTASPIPGFSTLLPATTDPSRYNFYAQMMPHLGIAMEPYNSASVGTIDVFIGK